MRITNFDEAHEALRPFYDYSRTPYTLDAMRQLMAFLGNPQDQVRVVHIAGTSGKTSTAYYTAALLRASGATTGLFVSPHVDTINERLQINGQPVPEPEYCQLLSEFLELIEHAPIKPSYFELVAALAYWEFARRSVDFAVMEVGLGGLLDATNVVQRSDKVCIITDIGLDHTEILGDTIDEIAMQKLGIVQAGNTIHMYYQNDVVHVRAVQAAERTNALLHEYDAATTELTSLNDLPLFQQRNLGLAVKAVRASIDTLSDEHITSAAKTIVPARLERFTIANKTIVVDGSHNQQKIATLMKSMQSLYPGRRIAALSAFVAGNDQRWQQGLTALLPHIDSLIITSFASEQDFPKCSVDPQVIATFCKQSDFTRVTIEDNPQRALSQLLDVDADILLVTGSLYLLNHIRPLIINHT